MDVQKLHDKLVGMSLGDLLLLAGQAANMPISNEKLDLLLKYVENAIAKKRTVERMYERQGTK